MKNSESKKPVSFLGRLSAYLRCTGGAVAVAFGLTIPVVVSAVGLSVDLAQTYLVRERLSRALDAAALAAASMASNDAEEIEDKVNDFIDANYPMEKIGMTYDILVDMEGTELTVQAYARVDTAFMRVIGIPHVNVFAETVVQREVRGLEVVLVLDNTLSMRTNDNIDSLKEATESFINILFDRADDPEDVRIGMVPYSNSVRIGRYGLGLNMDGTTYQDGDVFVTLPSGVSYTTNHGSSSGWYGCVVEHMEDGYDSTATHVANSKGQLWQKGTNWAAHGWDPAQSDNDPYPQDVTDDYEGMWDIYMYGKIIAKDDKCSNYSGYSNSRCSSCTGSSSKCSTKYCYCWAEDPNTGCPYANILPLSSDQEELLDRVEDMEPEGNTAGNVGMMWAYRLISPEPPFEEGSAWTSEYWEKAIIMMTDGDNTIDSGSTGYSYYGPGSKNTMTVAKQNERYAEICETLKDQGVLIYTVTFYSNISDNTKDFYRECATDETKYFDAPSQDDLVEVFEKISRELSNLYIKQ